MRIAKTYDVKFNGKMADLHTPAMVEYWVVDDAGNRQQVKITNHPKIREAFEWMSDNDCLRHLQHVGNSYTTNAAECDRIMHQNAMIEEHAHLVGTNQTSYDPMTGQLRSFVPGLIPVPEAVFECSWTFWSREHAVMFKLAMGGTL